MRASPHEQPASRTTPGGPGLGFSVASAALKEGIENLLEGHLDGSALDIRLPVDDREHLIAARTADQQRLRWHLHDTWLELEIPAGALDINKWLGSPVGSPARS